MTVLLDHWITVLEVVSFEKISQIWFRVTSWTTMSGLYCLQGNFRLEALQFMYKELTVWNGRWLYPRSNIQIMIWTT